MRPWGQSLAWWGEVKGEKGEIKGEKEGKEREKGEGKHIPCLHDLPRDTTDHMLS